MLSVIVWFSMCVYLFWGQGTWNKTLVYVTLFSDSHGASWGQ